ncbi:MAG: hypothetical protein SVX43_18795, partial [Cyanobacteriota bacterium]|nr:hypothetical protein [Cyanobacteriota bacterium]
MISIQKSPGSRIVPTEGLLLIAALVVGVDLSMGLTPLGVLRLSFLTALSAVPLLELSFPGGRWVRFFKKFTIRSGMPAVFLT